MNRKTYRSVPAVAMALLALGAQVLADSVVTNGLVSWWKFDEGTGLNAADSWSGNDGGVSNAVWTDGYVNDGLDFGTAADSNFVNCGDPGDGSLDIGTNDWTMEAWIKSANTTTNQMILFKRSGGGDGYGLIVTDTGKLYFRLDYGPLLWGYSDSGTYANGDWQHVAVTVERDGNATIYGNGAPDGTIDVSDALGSDIDVTTEFRIGISPKGNEPFDGLIDEVRVYNRALTAEEVWQNYFYTGFTHPDIVSTGLVSWWQFDEGSGLTAADTVRHNDGAVSGAVWTAGYIDDGLDFGGATASNLVYSGDPADGTLDMGTNDFSVEAWIRTTNLTETQTVLQKRRGGQDGYGLQILGADGRIRFIVDSGDLVNAYSTVVDVRDGEWHHIVGTADRDGNATVYKDGAFNKATDCTSANGSVDNAESFNIGLSSLLNATKEYFDGEIDEVRVYNRALADWEVEQNYRYTGPVPSTLLLLGAGLAGLLVLARRRR